MCLILFGINQLNLSHFLNIIFKVISGSLIYLVFIYLSSKTEINWFWQQIKCLKNKK